MKPGSLVGSGDLRPRRRGVLGQDLRAGLGRVPPESADPLAI